MTTTASEKQVTKTTATTASEENVTKTIATTTTQKWRKKGYGEKDEKGS